MKGKVELHKLTNRRNFALHMVTALPQPASRGGAIFKYLANYTVEATKGKWGKNNSSRISTKKVNWKTKWEKCGRAEKYDAKSFCNPHENFQHVIVARMRV